MTNKSNNTPEIVVKVENRQVAKIGKSSYIYIYIYIYIYYYSLVDFYISGAIKVVLAQIHAIYFKLNSGKQTSYCSFS